MKKILFATFAIAGALAISGCASLDERLASNDPRVKNEAEHELIASSRENGDESMRVAAVKRITNKDYLYEIAMDAEPSYRTIGGKKISTVAEGVAAIEQLGLDGTKKDDFKKLIPLIVKSKSAEVRLAALAKVNAQGVIAHVAAGNSDAKVRQAAWARVNTESGFAEVAKGAIDKKMAAAAFGKLKDQKYIDEVVLKTSDKTILLSGMGKVSDKTGLASRVFSKDLIGDNEVTGKFIADCADDTMLVKIVNEHGEKLTSEQFAAIKAKSKSVEVQNAIAAIADKKIVASLRKLEKEYEDCNQDKQKDLMVEKVGIAFASLSLNARIQYFGTVSERFRNTDKFYQVCASRLPENERVKVILGDIAKHHVYDWNRGDLVALEAGIASIAEINDPKSVVAIVSAILDKVVQYRKECKKSWTMSWGSSDEKQVNELLAKLPPLSAASIEELVCHGSVTWKYFIDKVTPEIAYRILTKGKAKSDELEVDLVKKLSAPKVDMKVFAGVKTDAGKKAVMAAMPAEVKKAAQESTAKVLAAVMDKAKKAKKETFEMHGFYLGMDWEDMKLVLSHHFPDYEITETRDGDDKDADYVVYITKQSTPFCYASAKDKKIYQFNFGKLVLKKWYKYDVQTFMEWARAYSRETGIDMKYKMLEKDTEVYEMDMSASYKVWFHQESYQYKHNTKEYRLTYFGEEKDYTYHGGLGGALIKERAASAFRYLRDNPGTLRAQIERD